MSLLAKIGKNYPKVLMKNWDSLKDFMEEVFYKSFDRKKILNCM
jgi:hypothetical protein